jgi:hypothetical protein
MVEITVTDLSDIVVKRLFSAGKMLLMDALKKLDLADAKTLTPEDAIFVLEVMRESMHTDVSKDAVSKCIEDLSSTFAY